MRMGKYDVTFAAVLVVGHGYQGRANYRWQDAGADKVTYTTFDRYFTTDKEAETHAEQQFALRVRDGTVSEV